MAQIPSSTPSNPLPPASAEYETAMPAGPGKLPHVQQWKMFRTGKGETHLDFGKTGLISKPGAKETILLDHVKKEARIMPAHTPAPQPPSPQAPAAGAAHTPAPTTLVSMKDLGKQTIGGHEAEGKMYTFQTPKAPAAAGPGALPGMAAPKPGALPKAPELPHPPGMKAPGAEPAPAEGPAEPHVHSLEVWTHTKLKVPVLTKAHGVPGAPSSVCKAAKGGEPAASLFQIPPGYKVVGPKL